MLDYVEIIREQLKQGRLITFRVEKSYQRPGAWVIMLKYEDTNYETPLPNARGKVKQFSSLYAIETTMLKLGVYRFSVDIRPKEA